MSNGDFIKTQQQTVFPQPPVASWVSKEVFDISLPLFRDATENKPSLCTFEQVENKNPTCPAMVPKFLLVDGPWSSSKTFGVLH
ncbi:hypothetical protein PS2_011782 [Malus domestica]